MFKKQEDKEPLLQEKDENIEEENRKKKKSSGSRSRLRRSMRLNPEGGLSSLVSSAISMKSSGYINMEEEDERSRYRLTEIEYYCYECGKFGACCSKARPIPQFKYLDCDCAEKVLTELKLRKAQTIPRYDHIEFLLLMDRLSEKNNKRLDISDPDISTLYEIYIVSGAALSVLKERGIVRDCSNTFEDTLNAEKIIRKRLGID